jgi:hypothetical protein
VAGKPQRQQVLGSRACLLAGRKPIGGIAHVQRLVRAVAVVAGHPGVHRSLSCKHGIEGWGVVEEFSAESFVETFHFPGGRRAGRFGESVGDAVVATNPVEQYFPACAESGSELFAIVGQDLVGHPVAPQGLGKRQTHRPPGGPHHHRGDDTKPGMVINPGDDLAFGAIDQHQATDNVQLP